MHAELAGDYTVQVSDGVGQIVSDPATLTFLDAENAIVVPGDKPTLQAALDAVEPGGTVFLTPGEYSGWFDFHDKPVTLASADGPHATFLGPDPAFYVPDTPVVAIGTGGSLRGFTFRNGGYVEINGIGAVIQGNVFEDAPTPFRSAASAIVVRSGGATISRNIFRRHRGDLTNGASIVRVRSGAEYAGIANNLFYSNLESECISGAPVRFEIVNNTFVNCNHAVGIGLGEVTGLVRNNVFVDILSGVSVLSFKPDGFVVDHNLSWQSEGAASTIRDQILGDPLFVNPEFGDYRLRPGSAAIDAGMGGSLLQGDTDLAGRLRLQGAAIDLGAYEGTFDLSPPVITRQDYGYFPVESDELVTEVPLSGLFASAHGAGGGLTYSARPKRTQEIYLSTRVEGEVLRLERASDRFGTGMVDVAATDENGLSTTTTLTFFHRPVHTVVVPDDFTHIQDAVDSVMTAGQVLVRPGIYYESVRFGGAAIFLRSAEGPERTMIVGLRRADTGDAYPSDAGEVSGFTLREGVIVQSPLENTLISCNIIEGDAGVLLGHDGAIFERNIFRYNLLGQGALVSTYRNVMVVGNLIHDNGEHTALSLGRGAIVEGNTIAANGVGLEFYSASGMVVRNNIVAGNAMGVAASLDATVGTFWENNLIAGNTTDYSVMPDQAGRNGNISDDPRFVAPPLADFRLRVDSPAIDVGAGSGALLLDLAGNSRVHGVGVDIGAFEFVPATDFAIRDVSVDGAIVSIRSDGSRPFFVETSNDLVSWSRITLLPIHTAVWNDSDPSEGQIYYRLVPADTELPEN
ncbi:MAG: right-handed parallel beta-helix repeat-containing protein [Verrucomicrobiales bacterium]